MADSPARSEACLGFEAENEDMESTRKKCQLDDLMNRLRHRSNHHRPWPDTAKALRMSLTDKRHQSEIIEKTLLHRHLETLQKAFKVVSLPLMLERLECLVRNAGLKFAQQGTSVFIRSDMFQLELITETNGTVKDALISHGGEGASCIDIVEALNENKFEEFTEHLNGLSSIYQINVEKKLRSKAYLALQSLESDLNNLVGFQSVISSVPNYIHKSPLGILVPRLGGLPMKMTFFVGPYDLLNEKMRKPHAMTVEAITDNKLGYSVTVGIEESSPHKLPIMPLFTVNKSNKNLPSFSPLNNFNSWLLPAVFSLRFQRPIPVSMSVIKVIQETTGVEFVDGKDLHPMASLIVQYMTQGKVQGVDPVRGLAVTLPDQQHQYFIGGSNGCGATQGAMVSCIPFTLPTHVPAIIKYLRQQVLFNTLIGSCVRNNPKRDSVDGLMFEVTPLSLQHITITFEHPLKETMATAELDLTEVTAAKCKLCMVEQDSICSDEFATKVLQRCLSLPVTLRAIFQKAREELEQHVIPPSPVVSVSGSMVLSKMGQERRQAFIGAHNFDQPFTSTEMMSVDAASSAVSQQASFVIPHQQPPVPPPPPAPPNPETRAGIDPSYIDPSQAPPEVLEAIKADKISKNPMLASLLDQDNSPDIGGGQPSSMLSQLLGDAPNPSNVAQRPRKARKRRSTSDRSPLGKSPKREPSQSSMDIDLTSTSPYEMPRPPSNPASVTPASMTPASVTPTSEHHMMSLVGEETFGGESHIIRLASSLDNIIKQETAAVPSSAELANMLGDNSSDSTKSVKEEKLSPFKPDTAKTDDIIRLGSSRSNSVDDSLLVKKEMHPSESDSMSTQEKTLNSLDFLSKTGSLSKNNPPFSRQKSHDQDPFDFNTALLKPESNMKSALSRKGSSNMDTDSPEKESNNASSTVNKTTTKLSTDKLNDKVTVNSSKDELKLVLNKERKKEKREKFDSSLDDSSKPPEKEKVAITVKLNTKEMTAKAFLKGSPHHRTESPQEILDLSSLRKEKQRDFKSKSTGSAFDKAIDLTSDGEVGTPAVNSSSKLNSSGGSASSSPRLLTSKKSDIKDKIREGKKRKSSKYGDDKSEKKRKRTTEEARKDLLNKKQKIYDFEPEVNEGENYRVEKVQHNTIKPTTIKIMGGKMHITSNKVSMAVATGKSSVRANSSSASPPVKLFKTQSGDRSASPKLARSTVQRPHFRSKSEGGGGGGKTDPKLSKTPSIKLKPISLPLSTTSVTVTQTTSVKNTQSPISGNASRPSTTTSSSTSSSTSSASSQSLQTKKQLQQQQQQQQQPAQKSGRKGSLSAVIDKLTRQHSHGSGSGEGKDSEKGSGPARSEKELYDSIRLAIVKEGTKPSTPTKDIATSFKSSQSTKKFVESTKIPLVAEAKSEFRKAEQSSSKTGSSISAAGAGSNKSLAPSSIKTPNQSSAANRTSSAQRTVNSNVSNNNSTEPTVSPAVTAPKTDFSKQREIPRDSTPVSSNPKPTNHIVNSSRSDSFPRNNSNSVGPEQVNSVNAGPPAEPSDKEGRPTKDYSATNSVTANSTISINKVPANSFMNSKQNSMKEDDKNKKAKVEDLTSRHFLDALPKLGRSSSPANHQGVSGQRGVPFGPAPNPNSKEQSVKDAGTERKNNQISRNSIPEGNSNSKVETPNAATKPAENTKGGETKTTGQNQNSENQVDSKPEPKPEVPAPNKETVLSSKTEPDRKGRTDMADSMNSASVNANCAKDADGHQNESHTSKVPCDKTPPPGSQSVTKQEEDVVCNNHANKQTTPSPPETLGSENKENKKSTSKTAHENDDVFRAPTPKGNKSEDRERAVKPDDSRNDRSRAKMPWSPKSDVSSPGSDLVIDYPGTPKSQRSPAPRSRDASRSPAPPPRSPAMVHSPMDCSPVVNKLQSSPSPHKSNSVRQSPLSPVVKSPMAQRNSASSPAQTSPVEIDDDLMDVALGV